MNKDEFKDPAGRLIKISPGAAGFWAFVPNPLPPNFELNMALFSVLSEVIGRSVSCRELQGISRILNF
jgi:hypothetical protein